MFFFDRPDQTAAIKMYERAGWSCEKMRNEWMERQETERYGERGGGRMREGYY